MGFQLAPGALRAEPQVPKRSRPPRASAGASTVTRYSSDASASSGWATRPTWSPDGFWLDGRGRQAHSGLLGCRHGLLSRRVDCADGLRLPEADFTCLDCHEGSVFSARKRIADAGLGGSVSFDVAAAETSGAGSGDLVAAFDCLYDLGDPVGCGRCVSSSSRVVELSTDDSVVSNMSSISQVYQSSFTFLCVPNSLSQDNSDSLGARSARS